MSQSPEGSNPSGNYETAWAAITELIHGEASWSGRERNVCYLNNGDGTFSDVSGAIGLDFLDDSRAFAAADLDRDGDLDLVLKSRNEPGLRVLRNDFAASFGSGDNSALTVRLRGRTSNRDAVGARVTVVAAGKPSTKTIRAGSGFLSQHSKELLFGLGKAERVDELRITWPSGAEQVLSDPPVNGRITIVEGSDEISSEAFPNTEPREDPPENPRARSVPFEDAGTWLIESVAAPPWELADIKGAVHRLRDYRGAPLLVNIWATWCPPCRAELRDFEQNRDKIEKAGLKLLTVSVDAPEERAAVNEFVRAGGFTFPVLVADNDFASSYNLFKRYLLNRRSDLQIPTTFLVNGDGILEKIYEGRVEVGRLLDDVAFLGEPGARRLARAIPFEGRFFGARPRRNYTELGAALLAHGLAAASLPYLARSAAMTPGVASPYYNLGTAYFRQRSLEKARASFEKALQLDPSYPEAHNSFGVLLARVGKHDEAIVHFQAAVDARAGYTKAVGNLATAYVRTGKAAEAIAVLKAAIDSNPRDPGPRNRLGLLHARRGNLDQAQARFREALRVVPGDPDTLTNLALLDAQRGNTPEAIARLVDLLRAQPDFDRAYLSLARIHLQANDIAKAREMLEGLIESNPRHREARRMIEQLPEAR